MLNAFPRFINLSALSHFCISPLLLSFFSAALSLLPRLSPLPPRLLPLPTSRLSVKEP